MPIQGTPGTSVGGATAAPVGREPGRRKRVSQGEGEVWAETTRTMKRQNKRNEGNEERTDKREMSVIDVTDKAANGKRKN